MLVITLARKKDGSCVLACARSDGTSTWQRHRHAFFPLHDLTHYAVETTLELRFGFFGLLADGWNITDFGKRAVPDDARPDAVLAEAAAGLLDQERATGFIPDADAFNAALASVRGEMGSPLSRRLTASELDAVRALFMELAGRWRPGHTLELIFSVDPQAV